jgi:hypothetical protein
VDEPLNLVGLDARILQQAIDAAIGGDDGVEDGGVRIGVELEENFWEHGQVKRQEEKATEETRTGTARRQAAGV